MATKTLVERSRSGLSAISNRCINFSVRALAKKMIDFSNLDLSQLNQFKSRYDAYIFDLDGCLISLDTGPIEGVNDALQEMERNGKCIMVLTDNCLHTLSNLAEKVNGYFPAIRKENVMNSGRLVVSYLKNINFTKKIYVIGSESGVITDLKDNGFDVLYEKEQRNISISDLRETKFENDVKAVLIAGDYNFNYVKMFKAVNYLSDSKVLFLQSHFPIVVQFNANIVLPAAGAIAECVKAASGRKETICVGKGSEYSSKYLNSLGFEAHRCLFVGDDISIDMVAGNMGGMDTMLVLTGKSKLETVEQAKSKNQENKIPTYYTNSVADLIKVFKFEG
ncbi:uncharacterized protein [Halyomorpha halys]|uniref:uncharacterized protein n=1 Tax=Halyomorpha halys TaxID=286706 RepID=UPI0006D4C851